MLVFFLVDGFLVNPRRRARASPSYGMFHLSPYQLPCQP
jgi:hypothetical protein